MTIKEYFGDWVNVLDKEETLKIIKWIQTLNPNNVCPCVSDIFKAFTLCTRRDCKVICIGQDPYPDKFMRIPRATGILFGNHNYISEEQLSPSLQVIKEASINLEISHNSIIFDQTLETWAKQGMLLINSALTCETNKIGSHVNVWRPFIGKFLSNMSKKETGIIYILFGKQAQSLTPYINEKFNHIIKIEHPAYYARTNTKMPTEVFKKMNDILIGIYGEGISLYKELN